MTASRKIISKDTTTNTTTLRIQISAFEMCGGDITKSIQKRGKHEYVWTHNHQLSSKEQPAKPQVINDGFQAIWLILLGYFSSKIY